MPTQMILARAIEVVVFLFAAFGQFFHKVAPPEEMGANCAVGLSSFLTLAILLFISALAGGQQKPKYRKWWFVVSAACFLIASVAGMLYRQHLDDLTFLYPPDTPSGRYVGGTTFTKAAVEYRTENPGHSTAKVVARFGGLPNRTFVWQEWSIRRAERILLVNYLAFVLSLSATLFALTEGTLVKRKV